MLNDGSTTALGQHHAFVLGGIVCLGLMLVALTRLVGAETRQAHNEFTLFTVTNMAVLYAVLLAFIAIVAWEDLSKASEVVGTEASLVEDLYFDAYGFEDKGLIADHLSRGVER